MEKQTQDKPVVVKIIMLALLVYAMVQAVKILILTNK
jgi:hypothetical protein